MKFYTASSFKNIDTVRDLNKRLIDKGFTHTYDWTQNERADTINQLREMGEKERNAVMEADFIVVLLPAGKGSHIEFGIAMGLGKKIFLYSPDGEADHFETTSTFYHIPEVQKCCRTLQELVDTIVAQGESANDKIQ